MQAPNRCINVSSKLPSISSLAHVGARANVSHPLRPPRRRDIPEISLSHLVEALVSLSVPSLKYLTSPGPSPEARSRWNEEP